MVLENLPMSNQKNNLKKSSIKLASTKLLSAQRDPKNNAQQKIQITVLLGFFQAA